MNRRHIWLILGLMAVFALLLMPLGNQSTLLLQQLQDTAHGPLFALLAAGLLIWLRPLTPGWPMAVQYLLAFVLTLLVGGAGELAQALLTTTRHARWGDFAMDALGASLGLGFIASREPASRLLPNLRAWLVRPLILLVACAIVQPLAQLIWAYWQRQHQLPELLTWNSIQNMRFAHGSGADLYHTSVPDAEAHDFQPALLVTPHAQAMWPGITIEEPWPDWSRYSALEIALRNPNPAPLTLMMRIDDAHHNEQYADRFNYRVTLPSRQSATLLISIEQIQHGPTQRKLDLHNIAQLILFQAGGPQAQPFILRRIRLVN